MRGPSAGRDSEGMERRRTALALLVVAAVFGAVTVSVAYGFALEYGDTGAGWWRSALDGVRWWWFGVAIVGVLALVALRLAGRSRLVRVAAPVLLVGTLLGTGAGAVVGVEQKLDRYPAVPDCVGEFVGGPALPVVRAAQAAYEQLDHPGPFSGGGSAGVDGCSSDVVVADGTDPRPAYRRTLAAHGWRVSDDSDRRLRAVRGGQAFELSSTEWRWTVWIGPVLAEERRLEDGEVGPRR
jgi:hypothetical protein